MNNPFIYLLGITAILTPCMVVNFMDFYFTDITEVRLLRRYATYTLLSALGLTVTIVTFLLAAKP